uniref:Uncharacterized protein n=1 Tax=Arundo donax TaxID=35708 RepID=A0A0A9CYR9_ARUDO
MSLSAGRSSSLKNDRYSIVSPPSFFTSTTSTDGATLNISAATASHAPVRLRDAASRRTPRAPLFVTRMPPRPAVASDSRRETTPLAGSRVAKRMPPACDLPPPRPWSNSSDRSKPSEREMRWKAFSASGSSLLPSAPPPRASGSRAGAGAARGAGTGDVFWNHGVLDEARDGDAGARVGVEQLADQLPGVRRDPRRAEEVTALHLPVHDNEVVVVERQAADEEHIEDDAAGPEVGLGAIVALPAEHLGGDVRRCAARGVEQPVAADVSGERAEPEVGDLEVASIIEEQVLGLEVAVVHPAAVAEVDGGDVLVEVPPRDVLPDAPSARDAGEELPATDELKRVDLGARGHHLVQLDDVGVGHHLLRHARALHLVLGQHLHHDAPPCAHVPHGVHPPEVAVPQHPPQLVLPLQHSLPVRRHRILHCHLSSDPSWTPELT